MKSPSVVRVSSCCFALLLLLTTIPVPAQTTAYRETVLASDRPEAAHASPQLLNPWGIAFLPGGNFFVAENASGRVDSYDVNGAFIAGIDLPAPAGSTASFSKPTGIAADSGGNFGPLRERFQFLVAADNGTIWGFSAANGVPQQPRRFVDHSSSAAVYTGIAVLNPDCCATYVAAANFGQGTIDTFIDGGAPVSISQDPFSDPGLPAGYAPFNIQKIGDRVFVTYAVKDDAGNPVAGNGLGIVNIFDLTGNFVKRFVWPGGGLSAPWGVAQASANFGVFSNDILIGDSLAGNINVFDPETGNIMGQLADGHAVLFAFAGLRALTFRADGTGDANTLYKVDGAQRGQQPAGAFSAITAGNSSTTRLSFSANRLPGIPITVTATVSSPTGVPTGTVIFSDVCCTNTSDFTQTQLGTATVVGGVAAVTSTFTSGEHVVTATYSGDADFPPSSDVTTLDVPFATLTTLVVPSAAGAGVPVTARANVTASSIDVRLIPGQVTFSDGNVSLGTAPLLAGTAQLTFNSLAPGAHQIVASYTGNQFFLNSQSAPVTITVANPLPEIVSLTPFSTKQNSGAFTLTVNGAGFVNGAIVTFNGSARPTTLVSSSQVTAAITAADLARSGTATVIVSNPGGVNSGMAMFAIDTATATSVILSTGTVTVTAGQSATLRVQPTGFTGALTATCLNGPTGVTCTFDQTSNSLTIQTAATTSKGARTITVVLSAQVLASKLSSSTFLAMSLGVLGLPLGSVFIEGRRRKQKTIYWIVPVIVLLLLTMAGCGGGYGGSTGMQPNPTPTLQTGQASASLTLTVQ